MKIAMWSPRRKPGVPQQMGDLVGRRFVLGESDDLAARRHDDGGLVGVGTACLAAYMVDGTGRA